MTTTKKIPAIVQITFWLVSLIVFAIGFWHTHLGVKEFRIFTSDFGSLTFASIVLLFLLGTYWFAINGRKLALLFYIICGIVFFICNLNYFYPSYMARTLIQSEAQALVDTLEHYSNGKSLNLEGNEAAISDLMNLKAIQGKVIAEIESNGFGPNAQQETKKFNEILNKYSIEPIPVNASYAGVRRDEAGMQAQLDVYEPMMDERMAIFIGKGLLKLANPLEFSIGTDELKKLKNEYKTQLQAIASDDSTVYKLDSIMKGKCKNVQTIGTLVTKLNGSLDKINKSGLQDQQILKRLDDDTHPRANKLGRIKFTLLSIKERINEIDTWSVIILCLFIDLIVPLGIYLLLRKKEDDPNKKSFSSNAKPTSF